MLGWLVVLDRMNRMDRMKTKDVGFILSILFILSETNSRTERAPLPVSRRSGDRVGLRLPAVRLRLRLRLRGRVAGGGLGLGRVGRRRTLPRRVGRAAGARRRV